MFERLLPLASVSDRFSQAVYRELSKRLLIAAGAEVDGLPLWISWRAYIDVGAPGSVFFGDGCVVSHYVRILTHDFSLDRAAARLLGERDDNAEYVRSAPVRIGESAFIGMNVIVLPGVSIGAGSIVGAGSVVTSDVPADVVVAGNPARVLGSTASLLERRLGDYSLRGRRR